MPVYISKKASFFLLLGAWCIALALIFLLNYVLSGPVLGSVYDLFLGFRPKPPISGDILVIETGENIEPDDVFSVLMTLSEMGASDLLIEVPVLGSGSGRMESGEELIRRVDDEFTLLESNIQNLFDAIRLGMIEPLESKAYVDNLVDLAEQGRDRINTALFRQDGAGSAQAASAAVVFGRSFAAVDLRVIQGAELTEVIPWYSRPQAEKNGIFRRIAPVRNDAAEHIVYHALKPRWTDSAIDHTELGLVLTNWVELQGEIIETSFPLDRDGNIIIEKPGADSGFRRISLDRFREYDGAYRAMAFLLKDADANVFAETMPERIPPILFDYAETLQAELLKAPDHRKLAAWISAREDYFSGLDDFLYGPSEMTLVNGYEEMIALEEFDETGVAKLQILRNELIRSFVEMREKHRQLVELRNEMTEALDSSFCIMGPVHSGGALITESSALFANALLTGHCVTPGQSRYIILCSLLAAFIVLACIHRLGPLGLLLVGSAASLLCGAAFGVSFIITSYWIDPFIPAAASLGGILFLVITKFGIGYYRLVKQYKRYP